jgi:hypothetical protein
MVWYSGIIVPEEPAASIYRVENGGSRFLRKLCTQTRNYKRHTAGDVNRDTGA